MTVVIKTCPGESVRFGDHCYKLKVTDPYPWYDAREVCLNMGGDLLIINSPGQQQFVASFIEKRDATSDYWIGKYR